jgi:hypothetical protein
MFQVAFGGKHERSSQLSGKRTVGDFALHIQCAWRLTKGDTIVAGVADDVAAEDESSAWGGYLEAINRSVSEEPSVEKVEAVLAGGFALALVNGFKIEVFPTRGAPTEEWEFWRLLRPAWPGPHFVVTSLGVGHDS